MRALLLAGAAIVSLAGPSAVHAADIYPPAPGYTQAPPSYQPSPPYYGPPPAPTYQPPPRYGYAPPPPAYGPPPNVAYGDDDEVAPPPVYRGAPVYAQRPRYDCWWEWGQRRCAPRYGW
jgi:hypothetical protein